MDEYKKDQKGLNFVQKYIQSELVYVKTRTNDVLRRLDTGLEETIMDLTTIVDDVMVQR